MIPGIFAAIELALKLTKLWDQFGEHVDASRRLERNLREKELAAGLEAAALAKTEEEAFAAQKRIVDSKP